MLSDSMKLDTNRLVSLAKKHGLTKLLEEVEYVVLKATLNKASSVAEAAKQLGLADSTTHNKIKIYGLKGPMDVRGEPNNSSIKMQIRSLKRNGMRSIEIARTLKVKPQLVYNTLRTK